MAIFPPQTTVFLQGLKKHLKQWDCRLPLQGNALARKFPAPRITVYYLSVALVKHLLVWLLVPSGFVKINKRLQGSLGKWLPSSSKPRALHNVGFFKFFFSYTRKQSLQWAFQACLPFLPNEPTVKLRKWFWGGPYQCRWPFWSEVKLAFV